MCAEGVEIATQFSAGTHTRHTWPGEPARENQTLPNTGKARCGLCWFGPRNWRTVIENQPSQRCATLVAAALALIFKVVIYQLPI